MQPENSLLSLLESGGDARQRDTKAVSSQLCNLLFEVEKKIHFLIGAEL